MEFLPSDRLKLRVDALRARLSEVDAELSALIGASYEVRERLHTIAFQSRAADTGFPDEFYQLEESVARYEADISEVKQQGLKLRSLLMEAHREYLRQLRKERPGQWIVLE